MNEYISSVEILRFMAALLGFCISWKGRSVVIGVRKVMAPPEPGSPEDTWDLYHDNVDRLLLTESLQTIFALVHVLLLINVMTNFFYISSPVEQPNVATSNVAQMTIPALLIWGSQLLTGRIRNVGIRQAATARRHTTGTD